MKTKVSLLHTEPSPSLESVCDHVRRCTALIGGLHSFLSRDSRVMVKPNVGTISSPQEARNTDPRVIEAMLLLLKEIQVKKIVIAESSIVGTDTFEAFKAMGIDDLSRRYKTELVDLKKEPSITKRVPSPYVFPSIHVSSRLEKVDVIINLPKLKTIAATPVSMGLKNLKGFLPDKEKKRFHHVHLSRGLADLSQVIKPQFTLIDGIVSSELYEPKETNVLFASRDVIAADSVASRAAGFDPAEIEYLRLASEAGAGTMDRDSLEIVGDSLEETHLDLKQTLDYAEAFAASFPGIKIVEGGPCSGCTGALYFSLKKARTLGLLDKIGDLTLVVGTKVENMPSGENILCIGNCTKKLGGKHFLPGCPFITAEFCDYIEQHFV